MSLGSQIITPASPETGSFVAPGGIGFLQHNTVIPGNSHLKENIIIIIMKTYNVWAGCFNQAMKPK